MRYFIRVQVHGCFASISSRDVFLYKEVDEQEFNNLEADSDFYEKYCVKYIENKTFYDAFLNNRTFTKSASKEEMDAECKIYEDDGYSRIKPKFYEKQEDKRIKKEDKEYTRKRKREGYLFYTKPNWKYNQRKARGGFSKTLWNYEPIKKYTAKNCFGYFGHSVRKAKLDNYLEKELCRINNESKEPMDWRGLCYSYLSSTSARHFSDSLEDYSFEEQKEAIQRNLTSMWNKAFIFSKNEHEGTHESTLILTEKYKDFLFLEVDN